eukprot:CAMPEP_0114993226 /NCGR_PEP_ID=MMETSP0216-20121206/12403_1 /TAXON_ID=223996 /ORGANISM="Protocruzia adherens, Strain Boccale" /LENGTH=571 /DNA_ID=CAMNT_0002356827 /DNA_START=118 /DNA_END=1833 /DNA_ORIENTATION=-
MKLVFTLFFVALVALGHADEKTHKYTKGEVVSLWADKVGPANNPIETYHFYDFPFCRDPASQQQFPSLGEAIEGHRLIESGYGITFREDSSDKILCRKKLSMEQKSTLTHAIRENYWMLYWLDDVPVINVMGGIKNKGMPEFYLYSHMELVLGYNGDQIVEATIKPGNPLNLEKTKEFVFSYSIRWEESEVAFENRLESFTYQQAARIDLQWHSLGNSVGVVALLISAVASIVFKAMKKDGEDDVEKSKDDFIEGFGWKQVSKTVWSAPTQLPVLSAFLSSGLHLSLLLSVAMLLLRSHPTEGNRGTFTDYFIFSYAIFAIFAGYYNGQYYAEHHGKKWKTSLAVSVGTFPLVLVILCGAMNTIAAVYGSAQAIPFGSMVVVLLVYVVIIIPMFSLGHVFGKSRAVPHPKPAKEEKKALPKSKPWYGNCIVLVLCGGVLPFATISTEVYFLVRSFWTFKSLYDVTYLAIVFGLYAITTACSSILCTFVLLNCQDYRWQWTAFGSGASSSVYLFTCLVIFYINSSMTGFFQFTFFFGLTALFCTVLSLVSGFFAYMGSRWFVTMLYKSIRYE